MFRILIIDAHALVRAGVKQLLTEEYRDLVIGEARTTDEALVQIRKQPWDVAILDISTPGNDRFYILQEIVLSRPETRILVLSDAADSHYAARTLQMGAMGFVCKNADRSDLAKALNRVVAGKTYFYRSLPKKPAQRPIVNKRAKLSGREHKVLMAVAEGKRTGQIAAESNLSVKTVSTYKRRILDKLGLRTTADMIRYAINRRLD